LGDLKAGFDSRRLHHINNCLTHSGSPPTTGATYYLTAQRSHLLFFTIIVPAFSPTLYQPRLTINNKS